MVQSAPLTPVCREVPAARPGAKCSLRTGGARANQVHNGIPCRYGSAGPPSRVLRGEAVPSRAYT
jgi:hypothetical protein